MALGVLTNRSAAIDGEVVTIVDGRVVVFNHGLVHEGKPVEGGRKFVLRNDVVATAASGDS